MISRAVSSLGQERFSVARANCEKNDYRLKSNCDRWKMRRPVPMRSLESRAPRAFTPGRRDRILVRRRRAPPSIFVTVSRHFLSGFSASSEATQMEAGPPARLQQQNVPENVDTRVRFG